MRERGEIAGRGDGFGGGHGADIRVGLDAGVEAAQEFAAVAGEIFPGILAVENQGDGERAIGGYTVADGAYAAVEVFGGSFSGHAAINEADEVGEVMVAEEADNVAFRETQAPGRVEQLGIVGNAGGVAAETSLKGAAEHALVAGKPTETEFGGDAQGGVGDGPFRGPQAGRRTCEMTLVEAAGAGELFAGILGMNEGRGEQRGAGIGFLGGAGVAQEGENGVVEGRGGDFNLIALRGGSVFGEDAAEEFELLLAEREFVALGEIGALFGEGGDDGVVSEVLLVHPGELGEELEVAPVAKAHAHRGFATRGNDVLVELHETRPARHHQLLIQLESAEENFRLLLFGQFRGGRHGSVEPDLVELRGGVFLELAAEGGNEIEGGTDAGKLLEKFDHAEIVFEGVEAGPGEQIATGRRVAVLGLVHVPEDDEVDGSHGTVASGEWPVASRREGVIATGPGGENIRERGQAGKPVLRAIE